MSVLGVTDVVGMLCFVLILVRFNVNRVSSRNFFCYDNDENCASVTNLVFATLSFRPSGLFFSSCSRLIWCPTIEPLGIAITVSYRLNIFFLSSIQTAA